MKIPFQVYNSSAYDLRMVTIRYNYDRSFAGRIRQTLRATILGVGNIYMNPVFAAVRINFPGSIKLIFKW